MKVEYYTSTYIHLSLEDYHNAGITSERSKEIIESIINPFQYYCLSTEDKLRCEPAGFNNNWKVHTNETHPGRIQHIVDLIEDALRRELNLAPMVDGPL